ncbi:MAG: dienelactone hydrolase family protein [Alphaproteobacteria bacterium]|nr:dienelactone hydrolase family protein [Alphaproteobacteria bacterium]
MRKNKPLLLLLFAAFLPGAIPPAHATIRDRIKERVQQRMEQHQEESAGEQKAETLTLGSRTVAIWRPETTGRAPLILFSHGLNGCETQSTFLTGALAQAGYFVAAPRHKDAICNGNGLSRAEESFIHTENWSSQTHRDRRDDMIAVLNALKEDPQLSPLIDFDNIGLLGHSLGGYTVLGLAGGWPDWKIDNVRAVVALSPVCQPFVTHDTLSRIDRPVQYQGGTRDLGITPGIKKQNGCYDQTAAPAMFVEFQGVGHFTFSDLQTKSHDSMTFYARNFFDRFMRGKNVENLIDKRPDVTDLRSK